VDFFSTETEGRKSDREERIAPHEVELIKYRSAKTTLQFKLLSGETIEGKIVWYDEIALKIQLPDKSDLTLLRTAVAYYKTRS
jgi:hypothetical protein